MTDKEKQLYTEFLRKGTFHKNTLTDPKECQLQTEMLREGKWAELAQMTHRAYAEERAEAKLMASILADPAEIAYPQKRKYRRTQPGNVRRAKADYNFCVVCDAKFYSIRSDAKTCSPKCRKALSRSAAGHLARLKRLAGKRRGKKPKITLELIEAWKLPAAKTPKD